MLCAAFKSRMWIFHARLVLYKLKITCSFTLNFKKLTPKCTHKFKNQHLGFKDPLEFSQECSIRKYISTLTVKRKDIRVITPFRCHFHPMPVISVTALINLPVQVTNSTERSKTHGMTQILTTEPSFRRITNVNGKWEVQCNTYEFIGDVEDAAKSISVFF